MGGGGLTSNVNESLIPNLSTIIDDMVINFENQILRNINEREIFKKRLLYHLQPALIRMLFNINVGNNTKVQFENAEMLKVVKLIVKPLETLLGKEIPESELELITLYFATQINSENNITKKKAAVVCSNGIVVSKILNSMLEKMFPEINIESSYSVNEFLEVNNKFDLVFTTIPLNVRMPQFIVKPILSNVEQLRLRQDVLNELELDGYNQTLNKIMKIIKTHFSGESMEDIKHEISNVLINKNTIPQNAKFGDVIDYICIENLLFCNSDLNWREAIKFSFEPFVEQGIVTSKYVDQCIEQYYLENGYPYFGGVMAIPHAEIIEEFKCNQIGLMICKKPILFPNGDKISFITPIALDKSNAHIKALNQLMLLSQDRVKQKKLLKQTDPIEVYKILEELRYETS